MRRLSFFAALFSVAATLAAPAAHATQLGYVDVNWDSARVSMSRQGGATTDRVWVRWDQSEPSPGQYDFSQVVSEYNAMRAQNVSPLFVVVGAPGWTHPGCSTGGANCPPDASHMADWRNFMSALAKHVPAAAGVEVWNEPNLSKWWVNPSPEAYTDLLKNAYSAIKSVEPQIPVIGGALCAGRPHGEMDQVTFLTRMYQAGAKGSMDGISTHTYANNVWHPLAVEERNMVGELRSVRNQFGDNVPFYVTEFGQTTSMTDPLFPGVSEAQQATYLAVQYRALAAMPDVRAAYVFRLIDAQPGGDMGVYRLNNSPKPAVAALADAVAHPGLPSYNIVLHAPKRVPVMSPVTVTASGYTGSAGATFTWLAWRGNHWSRPLATTTGPRARVRLMPRGVVPIAVMVTTPLDGWQSANVNVSVVPPSHKTKTSPRDHRAKKRAGLKRHAKAKNHRRAKRHHKGKKHHKTVRRAHH